MGKVLFLDFDGVLHPVGAGRVEIVGEEMVCEGDDLFCWAPLLESLLAGSDVSVVVHSTWRRHFTEDELKGRLGSPGLGDRLAGVTETGLSRAESILAYVEDFGVSDYAVLDDMPEEFAAEWLPDMNLVICDPEKGVSSPHVMEMVSAFAKGYSHGPKMSGG